MGDWNTLHFFDDRRFYDTVVPDLRGEGILLKHYFESLAGRSMLFNNSNSEARVNSILEFCKAMDKDFKVHTAFYEQETRKKQPGEDYKVFLEASRQSYAQLMSTHADVLEDFTRMFSLLIFAECASFNPHLIMGRRIFSGCVTADPYTISSQVCIVLTQTEIGSVFSSYGSGVMNWVTNEELQLLWLDRHHLKPTEAEAENYFNEFLRLVEIALENKLGLISVTNVNEGVLCNIPEPKVRVDLDVKEQGFQSIITYTEN